MFAMHILTSRGQGELERPTLTAGVFHTFRAALGGVASAFSQHTQTGASQSGLTE